MKLIIISGLSGSGKSVALHTLEDEEYYCVDNLPPVLLPEFVQELKQHFRAHYDHTAVCIDARTSTTDFSNFSTYLRGLRDSDVDAELVFFDAETNVLVKRFSETRRRHPLSHGGMPLMDAIEKERKLLSPIKEQADLVIDTSTLTFHDLRSLIINRVSTTEAKLKLSILFQSFGFKYGIPGDSDFIFDVRCLPNPYWQTELRAMSGLDEPVRAFLNQQRIVNDMLQSICKFLEEWIPQYQAENRRYITVSIGCNGGQHRSVYLSEMLAAFFIRKYQGVTVRHRELHKA